MTIDETIDKLISEKSDYLIEVINLIADSRKLENATLQAAGPIALLTSPDIAIKLRAICALCYLIGYDRAKSEIFENTMKEDKL